LIPEGNVKDLSEIPDNIKNRLEIQPVKWIEQVLEAALERVPMPLPEEAASEVAASAVASVQPAGEAPALIKH